jgi:hypothetical protein
MCVVTEVVLSVMIGLLSTCVIPAKTIDYDIFQSEQLHVCDVSDSDLSRILLYLNMYVGVGILQYMHVSINDFNYSF